ncbi:MAG: cupin domain-containing protein [Myxococcota bacterium]
MLTAAQDRVRALGLAPHPEGGFYRETARSARSTTILFLVPAGAHSAWHRVRGAEEVWHWYEGDPLELHLLDPGGPRSVTLGPDLRHHVVPPDSWQAAAPAAGPAGYSLVGCTVAPPFEFSVFELADPAALAAAYPSCAALAARFAPGSGSLGQ